MEIDIDNNQIQLLDVIGIPSNNLLFSSLNDTLVYSFGPNIIHYNLRKNTKTFLQYNSHNEISTLKYLDTKEHILLSIEKSSKPVLSIWELPLFEEIYSQAIPINSSFNISNIFIEKINLNLFVIIITSIDVNLLYILKYDDNFFNYNIIKVGHIPNLPLEIEGFRCFYDDVFLLFVTNNFLYYYLIDTIKIFSNIYNNNKSDIIKLYKKIVFPFRLIGDISVSNKYGLISLITSKGNCLIYNKNGDSVRSINPLENDESFTISHISGESLCLGTNSSKIYIYNIFNYKLKYFINDIILNSIKSNFQLNNDINKKAINKYSEYKKIEFINLNEKLDKIFIKMSDNSILMSPLTSLMDDSRGLFNFNSLGNMVCLYTYNHSKPINCIKICNNYNEYETVIYTCSKDQTIIQYNIDYSTNKLSNLYFNLTDILNNNQILNDHINDTDENNDSDKYNYTNSYNNAETYLTIMKFHPFYNTKLYAGDNKGYLYLFDISHEYFQYKKYTIDNYSIESLSFSREGNLICIGLITGKQVIYDIHKNFEFCLKLSENYLTQEEIDICILNYHMITFSYFFNSQKHRDCILFSKDHQNLEYSKLFYDKSKRGRLNKQKITLNTFESIILDVKVHISENYLIALNNKHQIIINEINIGETTAVIDLNGYVKEVYNFEMDRSGLYLGVICKLNNYKYNNNDINNDLILFEIGTGNIVSYIKCIGCVYKIIFDYYGKYIIMAGHKGELSLWKLSMDMSNIIVNVLYEMEKKKDFWEQFEIKYYNSNNNYENIFMDDDNRKIFRTNMELDNNESDEVIDYGPHKAIQTSGGFKNSNNNNIGNKMINPSYKINNNIYDDSNDDNYYINNKNNNNIINNSNNSINNSINNRINNKINNDQENDYKNDQFTIQRKDINKSIPMTSNNNNIYNYSSTGKVNDDENNNVNYLYNSGNQDNNNNKNRNNNNYNNYNNNNDNNNNINNNNNNYNNNNNNSNNNNYNNNNKYNNINNNMDNNNYNNNNNKYNNINNNMDNKSNNNNMKYSTFIKFESNNKKKSTNNSTSNSNILKNHYDNLNDNLKNENSLQKCYEKFRKERLMKNSLLKPNNNKLNKNKENTKLFKSITNNNFKSNKKINSLSSPKISSSNKYLKNFPQKINNNIIHSKEIFDKKEKDDIDLDLNLDIDINKIRPNFDPNLYSQEINNNYSKIINGLIRPFLSPNDEKKFSRYNNMENGNKILNDKYNKDNTINNIGGDNNLFDKNINTMSSSKNSKLFNEKKNQINNAMNVLMENKNNYNNNNQIKNKNSKNYNMTKTSVSSKEISHDFAYINNIKIKSNNNEDTEVNNNQDNVNFNTDNTLQNSMKKSSHIIIGQRNNNIINNKKNIDTISTEKRNYIDDRINTFEKKLEYYGK